MFTKILIANRAEIACRVIKTARRMGIATVAVYSDADRDALHANCADEAVHIGASPAAESYLDGGKIIEACKQTGAEAVHPGYGFLSENAAFVRDLEREGIVFIGPGAAAIEAMGDKIASKKLAREAGVNIIPGHDGVVADAAQAARIAADIGYPVMLKASAGGGGKGMRIARDAAEVESGFERAASEARSSFGDDRMLIEKFIEQPRHIEIQIIADARGNVLTLNERECSLQRRHQKVIEEAPSPFIDADTRAAMSAQAVALAKAVDYRSAGTVEFVVDAARGFYFLEMNTRLQVEHPVTEMITGLDLVELMIRVAAGEELPLAQSDIPIRGWAVESRIYAENPARNFLPSIGRLTSYRPPDETGDAELNETGGSVRVDSGITEGGEISRFYDPLIAKLVTWGPDRAAAIAQMRAALDAYYIRGVATNQPFVAALFAHPRFQAGDMNTHFIEEEYPNGLADAPADAAASDAAAPPESTELHRLIVIAALLHHRLNRRAAAISGQLPGYGRAVVPHWVVSAGRARYPVTVCEDGDDWRVETAAAGAYLIKDRWRAGDPVLRCTVNGDAVRAQFERHGAGYRLAHGGLQIDALVLSPRAAELQALMPHKPPPDSSRFLLSPMPGLLVSLTVEAGDKVVAGQELAVIEAMKMENTLYAEQDGVVADALAAVGDTVEVDQKILEFAPPAAAPSARPAAATVAE
ncbi:MAG: acetyl/propionyl/methylcrotonyl-CoA carboxylase subunit alpha [Gammaproteobacteria bacterium]|nr:acetyl/propionyl/methylcrotonyl-CoA carboxylase subunit alpha [Gammaproteobacteria bacterium]